MTAAPVVTPLALENAPLLRRLQAQDFASRAALASNLGRDPSNLNKTLARLAEEGLVAGSLLTERGAAALRAIDVLNGGGAPATASAPPSGFAELLWLQVEPDPLNPRKHFDEDALNDLATSILRDGLLENLVVRSGGIPRDPILHRGGEPAPVHRLVAGERRWRAIGKLIERHLWPAERPIMCKVVELDDAGHRRVALVENLQRKDLRPIDAAQALKELMQLEELSTAEVALQIGFTQRFVQQRLQLLDLPEKLQDQVNAGDLPIEKARTALALLPKLPPIKQVALKEGKITVDEAKAWTDSQPKPPELTPGQWVIALELLDAIDRRPMKKAAYEADRTEVGYGAKADGHLEQLAQRRVFGHATDHQDKNYEKTGRVYVPLAWNTRDLIELKFGVRTAAPPFDDILAKARAEAGLEGDLDPGRYHTEWLNPPFEVPELIAREYAAKLEKRKRAEAKEKAEKEARKRAEDERKAHAATNAEAVQELLLELARRPPVACDPRFAGLLATAGLPAPWCIEDRARVVAAEGQEVFHASWYLDEQPWILTQRTLTVAAVNLAAGFSASSGPVDTGDDGEGAR